MSAFSPWICPVVTWCHVIVSHIGQVKSCQKSCQNGKMCQCFVQMTWLLCHVSLFCCKYVKLSHDVMSLCHIYVKSSYVKKFLKWQHVSVFCPNDMVAMSCHVTQCHFMSFLFMKRSSEILWIMYFYLFILLLVYLYNTILRILLLNLHIKKDSLLI